MERIGLPGLAPAHAVGRATGGVRQLRQRLEPVALSRLLAARRCEAAVYAASLAAAWIFAVFALRRHEYYHSTAYDFGFFDQIIWNTSHGRWFETSFVDYNFLGQHVEPTLVVFAGAYRLGAGPELLLVVQTTLVAAAAIPLFHAVRSISGNAVAALLLAVAFLLNPSLHRALDFDFHPELLSLFFVFTSLYFVAAARPLAAVTAILPVLLLKEDMAIVVFMFGVLLWIRCYRRYGGAVVAVAVVWAVATVFVIMPLVRGGGSDLNERYHYLTADTNLISVIPVAIGRGASQVWEDTVPAVASVVVGTGGLALLHPAVLLAVPPAAVNGLADHSPQSRLDLHYAAAPLALLFVSSTLALGPLSRLRVRGTTAAVVMAAIAATAAAVSFAITSPYSPLTQRYGPSSEHRAAIDSALLLIPRDAHVSAQNTLLPHLSQRAEVFEFPDVREDTEVVVVDAKLPITDESRAAGYDRWLAELSTWGFEEVFSRDGVRLLEREVRQ